MVLPAYSQMEVTISKQPKASIQRQIKRKTNEVERIRQKIVMLQKELSDNDSYVTNLKTLLYCGARTNNGIFCNVRRLLEEFRGSKRLVLCSSLSAAGIVCLTSCAAKLDFGDHAKVIKLKHQTGGSAFDEKCNETTRLATYTTSVASLSISKQVCMESIGSDNLRYFNSSMQYTGDSASTADSQDWKVTKSIANTIASTQTRSEWPFPTSPMDRSSPWSPVDSSRSMDVSAMDLGPSASLSFTSGSVPSPRSYHINNSRKMNKRRDSRFMDKPRLISFDDDFQSAAIDDFPSAATDDSSVSTVRSRSRESQPRKCVEVRFTEELRVLQDEYFKAIEANDVVRVKLIIDAGVTIECRNAQSNTGLMVAAKNGFYKIVRCVLSAGAAGHVNRSNDDGFTALQYAAKLGDQDIVQFLLNCRADVDARNKFHQTPVILAARHGHSKVTEMLLGDGASVEKRDKGGRNALMMAARNGHVAVIEVLLKANASVNTVDRHGKTALTLMAEHACPRSIKGMELLLDYGVHARVDDDDGECALTYLGGRVKQGFLPLDSAVRSIAERMKRLMQ